VAMIIRIVALTKNPIVFLIAPIGVEKSMSSVKMFLSGNGYFHEVKLKQVF
jgi:hypothetical protein